MTRARGESNTLRALLERHGATVLELPAIAIEPPEHSGPLDAALRRLDDYDWIAFASRNAVHAVFERLDALALSPQFPSTLRVAAVGESTADELQAWGITVACVPRHASAAALASALIERGAAGSRILLPAGNLGRRELPDRLREAGALIDEVEAYRTVPPRDVDAALLARFAEGGIDIVVLGSPSAFQNLAALVPGGSETLKRVRLACMGPTTAAAARAQGMHDPIVAYPSTLDALVDAIVHHCSMENHREKI
ncbi:MAG: uroporphyrinogen-III synthase [Chloroflexota bacterium]